MAILIDDMVLACSIAGSDPALIRQIIEVESHFDPLAINVNGRNYRFIKPKTKTEAITTVKQAIAKGYSVDIGLMQINSRHLQRLGYTIADAFEPCKNIAAGSRIFAEFKINAKTQLNVKNADNYALSAYNTGNFWRGFANGYVAKYSPKTSRQIASTAIIYNHQLVIKDDDMHIVKPVLSENPEDAQVPGTQIVFTPEDAEKNGEFLESALSEKDAWDSNTDGNSTAVIANGKTLENDHE